MPCPDDLKKLDRVELERFLNVLYDLTENYEEVLRLAPDCKAHGELCLPHIKDWIQEQLHG